MIVAPPRRCAAQLNDSILEGDRHDTAHSPRPARNDGRTCGPRVCRANPRRPGCSTSTSSTTSRPPCSTARNPAPTRHRSRRCSTGRPRSSCKHSTTSTPRSLLISSSPRATRAGRTAGARTTRPRPRRRESAPADRGPSGLEPRRSCAARDRRWQWATGRRPRQPRRADACPEPWTDRRSLLPARRSQDRLTPGLSPPAIPPDGRPPAAERGRTRSDLDRPPARCSTRRRPPRIRCRQPPTRRPRTSAGPPPRHPVRPTSPPARGWRPSRRRRGGTRPAVRTAAVCPASHWWSLSRQSPRRQS